MVQGVKGPMLKQIRPAKFKLPVSYVDLHTGEELPVPEVMQRANSTKHVGLPTKIAKRRARIKSLKTQNMEQHMSLNGGATETPNGTATGIPNGTHESTSQTTPQSPYSV